jgi:hypothetical protein
MVFVQSLQANTNLVIAIKPQSPYPCPFSLVSGLFVMKVSVAQRLRGLEW